MSQTARGTGKAFGFDAVRNDEKSPLRFPGAHDLRHPFAWRNEGIAALAKGVEVGLQGGIRDRFGQQLEILLDIQIVARMIGKDKGNLVAVGGKEAKGAADKGMVNMQYIHFPQEFTRAFR